MPNNRDLISAKIAVLFIIIVSNSIICYATTTGKLMNCIE